MEDLRLLASNNILKPWLDEGQAQTESGIQGVCFQTVSCFWSRRSHSRETRFTKIGCGEWQQKSDGTLRQRRIFIACKYPEWWKVFLWKLKFQATISRKLHQFISKCIKVRTGISKKYNITLCFSTFFFFSFYFLYLWRISRSTLESFAAHRLRRAVSGCLSTCAHEGPYGSLNQRKISHFSWNLKKYTHKK